MSRATQPEGTQNGVASRPSPITKVPPEIITEVFKFAVLSSEEARSHGAKTLRLVNKYWNNIANATPDLWTKITLVHPLHPDKLFTVQKWLEASKPKVIDLEIYFCSPAWDDALEENWLVLEDPDPMSSPIAVLHGSQRRWRSISIKSDIESPIRWLIRGCEILSLPALESIHLERLGEVFGSEYARFAPLWSIPLPAPFCGDGVLMPKLREVSVCAVRVDWVVAATTSFENLRNLEIRNLPRGNGPTFEEFSEFLAASPRLETLDVSGYYPLQEHRSVQTRSPYLHLPALKSLVFGWSHTGLAGSFLSMFQIPETLEMLSLADTGSGFGLPLARGKRPFVYKDDSSQIFKLLADLGSKDSTNKDPSMPWISVLRLKSFSVSWVDSNTCDVITFLRNAPMIEEIRLTDASQAVLESIVALAKTRSLVSLKRLYLRWIWNGGHEPAEARLATDLLRNLGLQVIVKEFAGEGDGFTPIGLKAQLAKEDTEWAG